MSGWFLALSAFAYLAALFAVAAYGDRNAVGAKRSTPRPNLYALSIAVYCTSWTFFGSVGLASTNGFEFFTIFLGPIIVYTLGRPALRRVIEVSKNERITSIADFLGARYGKSGLVAAIVTLIAVVGTVPYIALQLKAISESVTILATHNAQESSFPFDISIIVALTLMVFTILFGTRHADATEHQDGLILAVALESAVKLILFNVAALLIIVFLNGGIGEITHAWFNDERISRSIERGSDLSRWVVLTFLSGAAILLLPRQFHVTVVENRHPIELRRASVWFPLYLIAISALVIPVAITGVVNIGSSSPADYYLITLPLQADQAWIAWISLIGGLSAATAMVIVACVALSIMISNDLILPVALKRAGEIRRTPGSDWSRIILNVRRLSIGVIILAGTIYHAYAADDKQLAAMGLLSFAAIAQLFPAFAIGLVWRGANARGAVLGLIAGFAVWGYTLLLPAVVGLFHPIVMNGIFDIETLRPQSFFGTTTEPLMHGVFWSLLINATLLVVGSLSRAPKPLERIQAVAFIPRDNAPSAQSRRVNTTLTIGDMKSVLSGYVGKSRMERAMDAFAKREEQEIRDEDTADAAVLRYAEQILASAIGSASARLVLSLVLEKDGASSRETVQLLDDASEALQQNYDLLQNALDQMDQGISVFDSEYRLTNWNSQFRRLLSLPPDLGNFGMPLKTITSHLVDTGQISPKMATSFAEDISQFKRAWQLPLAESGRIIEIRSNPMPDGGIVATYTDITGRVEADEQLKSAKESLELRVQARTSELTQVNNELAKANVRAEEANISKTRFLAAAGHDISQPLNAARLYASSLVERSNAISDDDRKIVDKIDASLEAVETIIGAVLDISRLDTGAMEPTPSLFSLNALLTQVVDDFLPEAEKKGLEIRYVPTSINVETDRNLLRRLIQNLISNAVKYTAVGTVLVGVRYRDGKAYLEVHDTGIGIPEGKLPHVFREFQRLAEGARVADGLGLGLSIVDRVSRVLSLDVNVRSQEAKGTCFSLELPASDKQLVNVVEKAGKLSPNRSLLTGLTAACIDNEESVLSGMTVLLSGWGARVVAATNRDDLFEVLEQNEDVPHVVLADYHLDDGDTGMSVISALRAAYGTDLQAVLITADRSKELREATENADVRLLNKPIKPGALRALLTSIPINREAAE